MIPSNALVGLTSKATGSTVMLTVDSVQEDGTVNLVYGDTVLTGIPCMVGYTGRKAGDTVLVDQLPMGWVVRGKTGNEPATAAPDTIDISWGQGIPGGGSWKKADTIWVRNNAVYAQLAADDPTPPQNPKTEPETVTNGGSAGYWKGSRRGSTPGQGMWPGSGTSGSWSGGFYFGDRVVNACAGQDVAGIEVSLARSSKRYGKNGAVTIHMYLIPRGTTQGPPPNMYAKWNGLKLSRGERDSATVPAKWLADLSSGAARGIGVNAGIGTDYAILTQTCKVTINFN